MQKNPKVHHPDLAKLSEDASIYQPENKKTTKEKLAEMDTKGKIAFIAEYYGISILVTLALVAAALFLVFHFLFAKDTAFNIMAVNTAQKECPADKEEFYKEFLEKNGIDLEKSEVSISTGLGVSRTGDDSASETNLRTIQTRLMSGSVDVFLADAELFYSVGEFEYLADLAEYLPEETIEKYKDDLVYARVVETGETRLAGIRLSASNKWLKETGWYEDSAVIGIADGAEHAELAKTYILEVLDEK